MRRKMPPLAEGLKKVGQKLLLSRFATICFVTIPYKMKIELPIKKDFETGVNFSDSHIPGFVIF